MADDSIAPGLDDSDKQPKKSGGTPPRRPAPTPTPPPAPAPVVNVNLVTQPNPPEPSKADDVEYGRISFQPKCESCSNRLGRDVRMVQFRTEGPIARYKCPECDKRIKHGRPWQQRNPLGHATPDVSARPDMR